MGKELLREIRLCLRECASSKKTCRAADQFGSGDFNPPIEEVVPPTFPLLGCPGKTRFVQGLFNIPHSRKAEHYSIDVGSHFRLGWVIPAIPSGIGKIAVEVKIEIVALSDE